MQKSLLLASLLAISVIISCSKDKAEDPNPCPYDESQLRYNGIIKNIINTNCATTGSCHGSPQDQGGGEYATYAQVKEKVTNGTFHNRVFVLMDMPSGAQLSTCDLQKLKDWVDKGAPE